MGVVRKLKRLRKQKKIVPNDIKRVEIADEAGVNNEEYLMRARTLDSYINPHVETPKMVKQVSDSTKETKSTAKSPASKKSKSFKL